MPVTVKIIKDGYGFRIGQIARNISEFEGGHLIAFKYAVPFFEKEYETQANNQAPEIRRRGRRPKGV